MFRDLFCTCSQQVSSVVCKLRGGGYVRTPFLREILGGFCFLVESVLSKFHSLHICVEVTLICHKAEVPQPLCARSLAVCKLLQRDTQMLPKQPNGTSYAGATTICWFGSCLGCWLLPNVEPSRFDDALLHALGFQEFFCCNRHSFLQFLVCRFATFCPTDCGSDDCPSGDHW